MKGKRTHQRRDNPKPIQPYLNRENLLKRIKTPNRLKIENMIEVDKRIPKREILKMYGIDRTTFELWVRERGLPVIEVSTHSKYVRETDLMDWEEGLIHKRGFREIGI